MSTEYAIHYLYHGLLRGYRFRFGAKYWLGACTEGVPEHGTTRNPFTRAYTKRQVLRLLDRFADVRLTKTGMCLNEIPYFGRRLRPRLCRAAGLRLYTDAMILRAGRPFYGGYLPIERWLGKHLGWSWQITTRKLT